MKLGHTNDEIKFDGIINGSHSLFLVVLDGEPTMHIVCDSADETRTIYIRPYGNPGKTLATKGRFEMKTKLTEDSDGLPLGAEVRVDRLSVYRYVLPRLHVLLGRLLRAA